MEQILTSIIFRVYVDGYPRWNPICIGQSIWISVDYDEGEKGMVEFDCGSNSMKEAFAYPHRFQPEFQSISGYNRNDIVVARAPIQLQRITSLVFPHYQVQNV